MQQEDGAEEQEGRRGEEERRRSRRIKSENHSQIVNLETIGPHDSIALNSILFFFYPF